MNDSISVAVYSTDGLGLMAVVEGIRPTNFLEKIVSSNSDQKKLSNTFQFPDGSRIEYDVNAPKNKWVIKSVDGKPTDRDFDKWPLIDGEQDKQ